MTQRWRENITWGDEWRVMFRLYLTYMLEKFDLQGQIFFFFQTVHTPQKLQAFGEVYPTETSAYQNIIIT